LKVQSDLSFMYPKEFIDEEAALKRKRLWEHRLILSISFLTSLFILGPLLHELGHMSVLFVEGCAFNYDFGLNLFGLYGSIQPLCDISTAMLLLFYSAGYITTIILGGLMCLYSTNIAENNFKSYIMGLNGVGLLLSILLSIGDHGDIYLVADLLGLSEAFGHFATLFLALGVSATSLRVLEKLLRQQEENKLD